MALLWEAAFKGGVERVRFDKSDAVYMLSDLSPAFNLKKLSQVKME